jgi:hypothetical protein
MGVLAIVGYGAVPAYMQKAVVAAVGIDPEDHSIARIVKSAEKPA